MIKTTSSLLLSSALCLLLSNCGMSDAAKKAAWQNPDIFYQYDAEGLSTLSQGWTSKFDTSGISFNDKHTCTLITPRHVVMAKHYSRGSKTPVIFHTPNGKPVTRHIIAQKGGLGDSAVGLLDKPVPANIKTYPLPRQGSNTPTSLLNRRVIVSNQHRQLFIHQIAGIANGKIYFKYPSDSSFGPSINLVSGDSGNPSFLIVNEKLVLIETHHTGGPGAGPFYGDPAVQAKLQEIISEMDNSYHIKTVAW